jgi:hypothetical protein
LGLSLDRAQEMLVGVLVPVLMLGLFELVLPKKPALDVAAKSEEHFLNTSPQNLLALKVMGITLILTGLLIILLGVLAHQARGMVMVTGAVIAVIGIALYKKQLRTSKIDVT